ncbi:MAG: hypothetical protein QGG54_06445, partial [Gammaproteobacteria bacterium]|nr:hypothetical protein [Gammaproteobacteria bacterium]
MLNHRICLKQAIEADLCDPEKKDAYSSIITRAAHNRAQSFVRGLLKQARGSARGKIGLYFSWFP